MAARGTLNKVTVATLSMAVLISLLAYFGLFIIQSFLEAPDASKGDGAIIEIYTLHALKGAQLLGPYSRLQWNNLGPSYFYALAPFYQLLGQNRSAVKIGVVFINLIAAISILMISWKNLGFHRFLIFAPCFAAYLAFVGGKLKAPWNPYVTVLPFMLLLFAAAAIATRRRWALPVYAPAASFVVQNHIMYLPTAAVITAAALIMLWSGKRKEESGRNNKWWPWWAATAAVLVVMWAPTIVEELVNSPGNLSRIFAFFTSGEETSDLITAISSMSEYVAGPLSQALKEVAGDGGSGVNPTAAAILLFLLLSLGTFTWLWERKRNHQFNAALSLLCTAGVVVALVGTTRIVGDIHKRLVFWTSALGCTILIAFFSAILHNLISSMKTNRSRWITASLALVLTLAISIGFTVQIGFGMQIADKVHKFYRTAASPLLEYVRSNKLKNFVIEVAAHDQWHHAAGIVLHLYRNGISFAVENELLYMYGQQFAATGNEKTAIVLTNPDTYNKLKGMQSYEPIIRRGEIRALLKRLD